MKRIVEVFELIIAIILAVVLVPWLEDDVCSPSPLPSPDGRGGLDG